MTVTTVAIESIRFSRRATPSLFHHPSPLKALRPSVTRTILSLLIVILGAGLLWKHVHLRQLELSQLRAAVAETQISGQRTADLSRQYSALTSRVSALLHKRPLDTLQFLLDLRDELGPDVTVQDLVLRNGSFQFQATGPGPLALMQRLVSDARFQDVRLLQTVPLANGSRQQFIVTGRYAK